MKILSEEFLIKLVCLLHNFKPLLLVAVKIIVMYLYIQYIHCRVFVILYAYIFSSLFPNEQGRQTDQCHDTGSFFAPLQNSGHILAFEDQIYPKSQGFLSFIVFCPKN